MLERSLQKQLHHYWEWTGTYWRKDYQTTAHSNSGVTNEVRNYKLNSTHIPYSNFTLTNSTAWPRFFSIKHFLFSCFHKEIRIVRFFVFIWKITLVYKIEFLRVYRPLSRQSDFYLVSLGIAALRPQELQNLGVFSLSSLNCPKSNWTSGKILFIVMKQSSLCCLCLKESPRFGYK